MSPVKVLIDVTAMSSGQSGVARWISGFCRHLESRGIDFRTTSAAAWAESAQGLLRAFVRSRALRDALYYAIALRRISAGYQRVVIVDNIGRLMSPLPAAVCPFYLIHDLIPLEMTSRFVGRLVGWGVGLRWSLSSRLYRWRLRRILFAPGAAFGYVSRATERSAINAFGEPARRGVYIGPILVPVAESSSGSPDPETVAVASAQRYVLAMGTGDPKKGLESLLTAWRQAAVSGGLRLVLFGSSWKGEGRAWVEQQIRDLAVDNVVHVGPVSDATLAVLYRKAAAFIFPSYFEGLGLPPAEFCIEGHGELILRDIPALREIYGDVAHFFSSDDALASLLRYVADDGLAPVLSPESRRKTLQERLDPAATFDRLWRAILAQGRL